MRRKVYPSQARLKELFDYSDGFLIELTNRRGTGGIGARPSNRNNHGRWRMNIDGQSYLHAVLVWIWHYGPIEDHFEIDHIDMINSNDRVENLRSVTRSVNMKNRGSCNRFNPGELSVWK